MFRKDNLDVRLDETIEHLLSEMAGYEASSKEYRKATEQLTVLYEIRKKGHISKDVLLTAAVHILGIVIIVGHERANVITSKAVTFLSKLM